MKTEEEHNERKKRKCECCGQRISPNELNDEGYCPHCIEYHSNTERDTILKEGHMDEELLTEDEKNELKIRLKQEKKKIIDSIIIHRHDQDGLEPIR